MVRPIPAPIHGNIDLKLGIKSSLPSVKPTIALLFLLWKIADKPSTLTYAIEDGNKIKLQLELENKLYEDFSSHCTSTTKEQFNEILSKNLMLNSQLEALMVTFELVWKVAKIRFADGRPNGSERTGGARFPKTLWFTANMDLFDIAFKNDVSINKVLYNWLGVDIDFQHDTEENFIRFLTILSESAYYKLKDGDNDVIFNLESLYSTILSNETSVDISGDAEAKGSLRILKSALTEDLYYNLNTQNSSVSGENLDYLKSYSERVATLHQLNPNHYTDKDFAEEEKFDASIEWFINKASDYANLDGEAQSLIQTFMDKFSPDKLSALSGIELLTTIFLNDKNTENLCRILEFNPKYRDIFGSIKGGSAYKYGLYFASDGQWTGGTNQKPVKYTEDEAIEVGTAIRDRLVAGAKAIEEYGDVSTLDDYKKLYSILRDITEGDVDRAWFLKYYQMLYPSLFAPDYTDYAQRTVLDALGIEREKYALVRMGQIRFFANSCGISNVVFNKIFWDNYTPESVDNTDDEIVDIQKLNFESKLICDLPRNRILFGAPGTGKSHTLDKETDELIKSMNGEYERVTFHPDYSYANFVGTYKPVPAADGITYKYVPGPFMRVLKKALENANNPDATPRPFVLVIEEINRANVAAVFGDVFQLLDRNGMNISDYSIQASEDLKNHLAEVLGGNPESYAELRIPSNMFIWATMNSADQGVFPMDTAFKRRWDFTYLGIDNGDEKIAGKTVTLGKGDYKRVVEWNKLRKAINGVLSSKDFKINEDKLMGPYFLSTKVIPLDGEIDEKKFVDAFKSKVIMYLFEDAAKQKKHTLFKGCSDTTRYSSIRDEFDTKGVFIFCDEIHNQFPASESGEGETE